MCVGDPQRVGDFFLGHGGAYFPNGWIFNGESAVINFLG